MDPVTQSVLIATLAGSTVAAGASALMKPDDPKLPEITAKADTSSDEAKANRQREYMRKYGKSGRAGTTLREGSTLG